MTSHPTDTRTRVTVLGAGPIGLDAALAALESGAAVTVYEAGQGVGTHVREWGHVRLFTPWSMASSARMRRHLEAAGTSVPVDDDACPAGQELVDRVLVPLARLKVFEGVVRTGRRVLGVARRGLLKHEEIGTAARAAAPFRVLLTDGVTEWSEDADVVLDATGSWGTPNAVGDGGVPAPGERGLDEVLERRLPDVAGDPARWAGRSVLLVGAGKSAQTAARELSAVPRVALDWVVRSPDPDWGAVPDDPLPERAALVTHAEHLRAGELAGVRVRTGTTVETLRADRDRVEVTLSDGSVLVVDDVVALTGSVGDHELYRQLQVHECYATGAPMSLAAALLAGSGAGATDCLAQPAAGLDTLRTPEPGFFVVGAKSYGRANTFLLRVGYEQVDEIATTFAVPGT